MTIPRENHLIWVRYAASLSIVLSHSRQFDTVPAAWAAWVHVITWHFPGVPVLFFISGYLVSLSFRQTAFWPYIMKRFLRVYPPLWVSVILTVIALFVTGALSGANVRWGEFALWFAGQMSFVFVYHPDFFAHIGVGVLNGSLWAIPVIVQFYALLPLISRFDTRFGRDHGSRPILALLLVTAILNIGGHYLHNNHESPLTKILMMCTVIPMLYHFVLGYVAQRNFAWFRLGGRWAWLGWLVCYFAVFRICSALGLRWGRNDINPLLMLLLSLVLINLAYLPSSSWAWFRKVEDYLQRNDISFGMFVYHMVVVNLMMYLNLFAENWPLRMLTFLLATIVISALSMRWLERPIRDRRERIISWTLTRFGRLSRGAMAPES